jgi:hypothetical protein
VTAGGTSTLPDVTLLGGDCSLTQGIIDGVDAVVMGLAWGSTPGDAHWRARADVRDDEVINVLDLTAVKFNWLQAAPGPWPGSATAAEGVRRQPRLSWPAPQAATQATVMISPPTITTSVGTPATVAIWVEDVENLYGGGFGLDFDASVVNVQDANAFQDGVQIESGSWLEHQLEVVNSADNTSVEVDFFVTQSHPATAKDGSGILARITFVGVANGSSALHFSRVQLVDDEESEISATVADGQVTVEGGYSIYLPLVVRDG